MSGYKPIRIQAYETGLVKSAEEFLLPEDAYPILENCFVWRKRIKRKQAYQFLGRLQRNLTGQSLPNTIAAATQINYANILTTIGITEATATLIPGSIFISSAGVDNFTFTDNGDSTFSTTGSGTSVGSYINYATGEVNLQFSAALVGGSLVFLNVNYYPNLPVMGICTRELNNTNNEETIIFDTVYAYRYSSITGKFEEFIPGTIWTGTNYNFFWSTNYWTVGAPGKKLFWVTNFKASLFDPIRYTDGTTWTNFSPVINLGGGTVLTQCLAILPFRGRLLVFNTIESGFPFQNRIRWSQIGSPLNADSWHDDVAGKGGFLDIPTSQDIISVGFVRDNLVIYCERSTWQLRYTGRSIAPFQIEKVNSELGAESTFSAVQFDTSIVGIGDKGIVECDSFKSQRIDIKIPDLVFEFNNANQGTTRVHGIRDFVQRLAYWTYPEGGNNRIYPNKRLVYNYDNDSWAIFTDSLTALGNFQPTESRIWSTQNITWNNANFSWVNQPTQIPAIIGGNQQGYIEYVGGDLSDGQVTNAQSLYIKNITGYGTTVSSNPVSINSPDHNLDTGQVIQIVDIIAGSDFYNELNNNIYMVTVTSPNDFYLTSYSTLTQEYNVPALADSGTYLGNAQIKVRDNFNITSKKFNYMELGKQFQLGYIDILMNETAEGAITMNIYNDYNDGQPSNTLPQNAENDDFFNSTIPTNSEGIDVKGGSKNWKRVFCATNSNFITIQYTLSNEQMQNVCQESDVQIDAQILWQREGGRLGITQ